MEQLVNRLIQTSKESLQNSSREELLNFIFSLRDACINVTNKSSMPVSTSQSCAGTEKQFDFNKHGKRKIALRICYLGWKFDGFASQPHSNNTVEEHLFRALVKTKLIESRETSDYTRAARTDKGVSAIENVVSLTVRSQIMPPSSGEEELDYSRILNGVLPSGIWITGWTCVEPDFHARFSASYRVYHYYFRPENLNLFAMQRAAQFFVGEHDFRNFCKADVSQVQSFRRIIYSCDIKIVHMTHRNISEWQLSLENEQSHLCHSLEDISSCISLAKLVVKGQAFLWHQIRCMASVLFMIGQGTEKEDIIKDMLNHESFGAKPLYRMASEIPLVLSQIGFAGGFSFQCSWKAYIDMEKCMQEICTGLLCKTAILKDLLNSLHNDFRGISKQRR